MKKKNGTKNDKPLPTKVPQPHGGALNSGGTPGNRGGTGRPPNLARLKAGEGVVEGVDRMRHLMFHAKEESNQIRAFEALVKLLPQQIGEDPEAPFNRGDLSPADRLLAIKQYLGL